MKTIYEEYKSMNLWSDVKKMLKDLEKNHDLKITTNLDHVVGYCVKKLDEKYIFSKKESKK